MSVVNAGLVWGTPVRPDLLGQHLQIYKEVLPTLTALRLCHRFGTGSDVHITKLPLEVEQSIEDIIFEHGRAGKFHWTLSFEHFESRCDPVGHLEDGYPDIFADVHDELHDELCDKCKDEFYCSDECEGDCEIKIFLRMNEAMCEVGEWKGKLCEPECEAWKAMIDQNPNGAFGPYDKILRQHFGLEAYFATTRVSTNTRNVWPDDVNHIWHFGKELQTTICYLTLPKTMSGATEYATGEIEDSVGYVDIHGSGSCLVECPTLQDRDKRVKQFQRALRALKLKPYVHPSQLNTKVSATSSHGGSSSNISDESQDEKASRRAKELAKIEWPQLVMLVKSSFNFS